MEEFGDLKAAPALNEDLTPAVRPSKLPCNIRGGAYFVKVLGLWSFYIRIALDNNANRHSLANRLLDGLEPCPAPDISGIIMDGKSTRLRIGRMTNAPSGILRRGLDLGDSFLFSLHECFLISMMNSPSWKEISPTDRGFSPPTSLSRRSKRPSGISHIFSSPSAQHLGSGRSPRDDEFASL